MLSKSIFKFKFISSILKFQARTLSKKSSLSTIFKDPKIIKAFEDSNIIEDEIFSETFEDPKSSLPTTNNSDIKTEIESSSGTKIDDVSTKIDKEKMKFIRESLLYSGEDPFPDKLVERPEKGVVWGLGGELLKFKENFFKKGVMPSPEEVIAFLELEQAKDITLTDLFKLGRTDIARYGIVATTFSSRHNYKIAKSLLKAILKCEIPHEGSPARIHGSKSDEWVMVSFKDLGVHLFVQEARDEIDLEWKWNNPPKEEETERLSRRKRKKGGFEPFDE